MDDCGDLEVRRRPRSNESAIFLCKLVFILKHAVAAVDIAPREWLRRLFDEILTYFCSVRPWRIKPGFGQAEDRIVYPGRA